MHLHPPQQRTKLAVETVGSVVDLASSSRTSVGVTAVQSTEFQFRQQFGRRVMPCVSEKWADLTEKLIESFITASILRSRKLLLRQSERLSKQAALLLGIAIWPRFGSIKGRDCVSEQTRL